MNWEIEYTDEFECWWDGLGEDEQASVESSVRLLGQFGPSQHAGRPYRVLYAFDPRRCALLLIGGEKTGQNRWYDEHVPLAERLYREHLETLRTEGLTDG